MLKITFFPRPMYPKIRIGKFNTKLIIPVFTGVTIPKIIAIPPIPLLKILWGIREKIKGNRNNNRTNNNTKKSDHLFPVLH